MTNYFKNRGLFQWPRFSQHDGTLGLWHAGRAWRKATDTEFVFHSVTRKRSKLPSSFTQTAETYCAASNKEQSATAQGSPPG